MNSTRQQFSSDYYSPMKRAKEKYAKLNHLLINVRDAARSRDWYVKNLGLKVEFEVPENGFVALEDDGGWRC